jgi:hypothetical protein
MKNKSICDMFVFRNVKNGVILDTNEALNDETTKIRKNNGQFAPGNKEGGRKEGSKNNATLVLEKLLDGNSERIFSKVIEMAVEGDPGAMKICAERLVPPKKERRVPYNIGEFKDINKAPELMVAATNALLQAEITESQAHALCSLLEQCRKSHEMRDVTQRLDQLCEHLGFKV